MAFEDREGEAPLAASECRQEPAADVLGGEAEDVTAIAMERTGACSGCSAAPVIFHEVAAAVVGCILRGAMRIFGGKLDGALGRLVLSTASKEPGSSVENRDAHAAYRSHHDPVADVESVVANDDERLRPPHIADSALHSSSFSLQAVSYPLTPRRLIALRDRNELSLHDSDAKLQASASSEPALHAAHAVSGGQ